MNITVKIEAPELAVAIQALAEALKANPIKTTSTENVQQKPVQQQPVQNIETIQPQVVATAVPTAQPNLQQQAPVQQQTPTQQPVPIQAPQYTMDQLAVAATQLMDAGKQPELLQLLASFGVQALMQLPKEHYGAFATKLRELGAKI